MNSEIFLERQEMALSRKEYNFLKENKNKTFGKKAYRRGRQAC